MEQLALPQNDVASTNSDIPLSLIPVFKSALKAELFRPQDATVL